MTSTRKRGTGSKMESQKGSAATPKLETQKLWTGFVSVHAGDVVFAKTKGFWYFPATLEQWDSDKQEWKVVYFGGEGQESWVSRERVMVYRAEAQPWILGLCEGVL